MGNLVIKCINLYTFMKWECYEKLGNIIAVNLCNNLESFSVSLCVRKGGKTSDSDMQWRNRSLK